MNQQTFSSQANFEKYGRKNRREMFLEEMELVVPWAELQALIEPHYAKAGNGRQPVGLAIMLRIYFLQQWFNLSDPGVEEALYESSVLLRFVGVDLGRAAAPDKTTICRFRHLLEKHELGRAMLHQVNEHLATKGHQDRDRHHRGRNDYPCAFVEQERETGARPGDAPDAQRLAMVLWAEGAHRHRLEDQRGAFGMYVCGIGIGLPYAAAPAAWRGVQGVPLHGRRPVRGDPGVGRRRLSGPDRSDPPSRCARPGHDLPQNQIQEPRRRDTKEEE
jgi:hypothetical protein